MKTVIITGASQGIGEELFRQFSFKKDICIYALSRNIKQLNKLSLELQSSSNIIIPYKIDLKKEVEITQFVKKLLAKKVMVDVLINNAGVLINKKFIDLGYTDIESIFQTNVYAPILLIKNLINIFSHKAHIINIGSMGGVQGSLKYPGLSAYSSSKAAVATLTECLAEEFKDTDLIFNCLALGATKTEMLKKAFPDYEPPINANQMARFIMDFSLSKPALFKGKILPVSMSTP